MPHAEVDGIQIAYDDRGSGDRAKSDGAHERHGQDQEHRRRDRCGVGPDIGAADPAPRIGNRRDRPSQGAQDFSRFRLMRQRCDDMIAFLPVHRQALQLQHPPAEAAANRPGGEDGRLDPLGGDGDVGQSQEPAPPAEAAKRGEMLKRVIPASSTHEAVPVIGMGTWNTFDVGRNARDSQPLIEVLQAFYAAGASLIDSSPMYGTAEAVTGDLVRQLHGEDRTFYATKVWTHGRDKGIAQMQESARRMGVDRLDLIAVHNLLDWEVHLATLKQWREEGRVRYIGITTSHGRRHEEFERVMREQTLDFVQVTYNILDREAEDRLLPLAAERGFAVIINRPFRQGALFPLVERHKLPDWAAQIGCANWAQFLLKFIVSHPAVTCVIPATSQVAHMEENMGALHGPLPDPDMRARMVRHIEAL